MTKVTVRLLVDSNGQRVIFAEAGKDFVDFLFSLLSLPIGSVVKLLTSKAMVGAFGKLYESFANLNDTYIQTNVNKDTLLNPNSNHHEGPTNPIFLLDVDVTTRRQKIFICDGWYAGYCDDPHFSDESTTECPICGYITAEEMPYVAAAEEGEGGGGFVKEVVTYMIMDDLEVKPMSMISNISMLNKFNINDVGVLEEKVVTLGLHEGLKLLKASLETKNVLSNVFLGKSKASK